MKRQYGQGGKTVYKQRLSIILYESWGDNNKILK